MNPWVVFDSPSNANDFALARSNISDGTKGFYQFTNPALLPKSNGISYGMSYNMMSLDRSNQSLSINIPLPPQAAVALSIMRSGTSNIQGKDIFNNSTDIISDHEILGMISFGVSFNRYMSVGINIKASHANLDNIFGDSNEAGYSISNKGIGIDGGFLINYPTLSLGIKVENFKSSKNWSIYSSEQGNSYEEQIPTIYKIGAHYNIIDKVSLYCATDFLDKWKTTRTIYRLGIKTDINNFGVRLGYAGMFDRFGGFTDYQLPVLGFYYSIGLFQFNYGVDFGSVDEGISHIFSWTFAE